MQALELTMKESKIPLADQTVENIENSSLYAWTVYVSSDIPKMFSYYPQGQPVFFFTRNNITQNHHKGNFQDPTQGQPRKLLILITLRSLRVLVLILTGH